MNKYISFNGISYDGISYHGISNGTIPRAYVLAANASLRELFDVPKGRAREFLVNNRTRAIFCVDAGTVAGFVTAEEYEGLPYIGWLVTMDAYQRQGIASTLVKKLQQEFDVLTLHEDSTDEGLKNFYLRLGFKIDFTKSREVPREGGTLLQYYMIWKRRSILKSASKLSRALFNPALRI
jgi:ribosomal protein S18 acetylase RimI-like enzyme